MTAFFEMGGYAQYVWPAYGASALVIGGLAVAIWRRGRTLQRRLARHAADNAPDTPPNSES